ncbi:MAG: hypothetical protein PVF70_09275, partial [Anaerolineales bacterium]
GGEVAGGEVGIGVVTAAGAHAETKIKPASKTINCFLILSSLGNNVEKHSITYGNRRRHHFFLSTLTPWATTRYGFAKRLGLGRARQSTERQSRVPTSRQCVTGIPLKSVLCDIMMLLKFQYDLHFGEEQCESADYSSFVA